MAGIYAADIYCDDCIEDIKHRIAIELRSLPLKLIMPDGADISHCYRLKDVKICLESMDERDYDSGEYPKYCPDDSESDSPQHCGSHEDCINADFLTDGTKIGYCFGNELTDYGAEYVKEAVRDGEEGGVAREVWAKEYDYLDFDDDH